MKGILSEIGRLNHIAIAVPNIQKASSIWENALGANISSTQSLPEHGVKIVFIESPNTKVELLEPLNKQSPISKFLERNPNGGMHHMCYEVSNLESAIEKLCPHECKVLRSLVFFISSVISSAQMPLTRTMQASSPFPMRMRSPMRKARTV